MATTRIGIPGRYVDLYVSFRDSFGNPADTDDTPQVKITDPNGTVKQSYSDSGVSSVDTGVYYLSYEIPDNGVDGYWTDTWKAEIGSTEVVESFEFQVLGSGTVIETTEPEFTAGDDVDFDYNTAEIAGINYLLKILKPRIKNNGVRKVPDGSGGFTTEECNIFTNDELIVFLTASLAEFNSIPHTTAFRFSDDIITQIYSEIITQGAVLLAYAAQMLLERGREFSITDSGVTFTAPAISELLSTQYAAQLADYKDKLKFVKASLKPKSASLGTYRITAISPNYLRLRHLRSRQII